MRSRELVKYSDSQNTRNPMEVEVMTTSMMYLMLTMNLTKNIGQIKMIILKIDLRLEMMSWTWWIEKKKLARMQDLCPLRQPKYKPVYPWERCPWDFKTKSSKRMHHMTTNNKWLINSSSSWINIITRSSRDLKNMKLSCLNLSLRSRLRKRVRNSTLQTTWSNSLVLPLDSSAVFSFLST